MIRVFVLQYRFRIHASDAGKSSPTSHAPPGINFRISHRSDPALIGLSANVSVSLVISKMHFRVPECVTRTFVKS